MTIQRTCNYPGLETPYELRQQHSTDETPGGAEVAQVGMLLNLGCSLHFLLIVSDIPTHQQGHCQLRVVSCQD